MVFCCKICVLQFTLFCHEIVLSRFTRYCVEKIWAKICARGEKLTNMRYASAWKWYKKGSFQGIFLTPPPKWAMPKWRACEFGRDFPHPPSTHRPSPYPTCSLAEPCLHSHKLKVLESPVQIIEGKSIQSFRKSSSHVHVVPLVAHVKAGCSCC